MFETIKAKLAGAYKSLTIWFNSAMAAIVAALPMMQESLPWMQAYLPANLYQYLMAAVVLGNIALRFKTNNGLEHK